MAETNQDGLSPIKRALLEIRDLKTRLAAAEERAWHEPIALVGMAMRLPGGIVDAQGFARLLWAGEDAVGPIPPDRWNLEELYDADPDAPGKMTTRYGAFIDGVDRFDAEFFGIAPREAASMDPQQRLLLEVTWEALENAGVAPRSLAGSKTGVYLGIANSDYGRAVLADESRLDVYATTGSAHSIAAGRLSYFLGLHGPSMAIDTACSSSLSALHLACQALRAGDCDRALVGGVNLILSPHANISFSKGRMMAVDGRCKTFDAAADGYVRGEGCGVIVVRRLRDAVADGDRILAVVRATALNQDGRSGGLTAPNGPAQEAVLRAALETAQLRPDDVSYIEAHGTGTPLGDPIELNAIRNVFGGAGERAAPLFVASVKTNLGHLEAAAGIAGVIKVVLMLQRREIPPHLNFREPNPYVDWAASAVSVPTEVTAWRPANGSLIAGVSSFGFSGTNAHAILEEPPRAAVVATAPVRERPIHLLALSARDDASLAQLVERYRGALEHEIDAADACHTAGAGRSHFPCRLSVAGQDLPMLRQGLAAFAEGRTPRGVVGSQVGVVSTDREPRGPRIAFLFTGYGVQYPGMAHTLYESSPVFRDALDRCAQAFTGLLDQPLQVLLRPAGEKDERLDDPTYGHPALFAIEYALAELWRSWGVQPAVMLGHSLGEYAAACQAGVLQLGDAAKLVAARGRLSQQLAGHGAMLAAFAPAEVVAAETAREPGALWIAAFNGPNHHVLSGTQAAVDAAAQRIVAQGFSVKPVRVKRAYHSPLVEPVLAPFAQAAAGVSFRPPRTVLISNVSGRSAQPGELESVGYWMRHMREPVRFADSLAALLESGVSHCVEIGPHPVLTAMGTECLPNAPIAWLPSIRRAHPEWPEMLDTLQQLYAAGVDVDWAGFDRGFVRRRVALPTYPFRDRRHWVEGLRLHGANSGGTGPPAGLASELERQSERGPLDFDVLDAPQRWDLLARITAAHAMRVLRDAGLFTHGGECHSLDGVLARSGIGTTYRRLVRRWLDDLVVRGALSRRDDQYVGMRPLPVPEIDALWREAERRLADDAPLLRYLKHCGELIGAVLTGRVSPLETLFPGGDAAIAEALYSRAGAMRYVNALAATALRMVSAQASGSAVLRVLEIGAGTGGTTEALLPVLPSGHTRYRFTDVSDLFLDRARERFASYPFIDYGRLDLESDPAAQGYPPAGVDVVVAANVVHATRNVPLTLARLRALLAPGGMLLLVESTRHHAWFDMSTGLIEGWQAFDDDLRADDPLLSPSAWASALEGAGFVGAGTWPPEGSPASALGQHVVIGWAPGSAPRGDAVEPLVGAEARTSGSSTEQPAQPAAQFDQVLRRALPDERGALMRDYVRQHVMAVLRSDPTNPPDRHQRLMDLGMDSLMAVQLRGRLAQGLRLDRPLPASLMFDQPTIEALARHLLALVTPEPAEREPTGPVGAAADARGDENASRRDEVAAMSDAQIESLLLERLGKT